MLNYAETCAMLEEAGACAITMHGRTRDELFRGVADWTPIAEVKAVAKIPIIGNGDVVTGEDYLRIKSETACDAVMVARGAIGNPFIFEEMHAAARGEAFEMPDVNRVVTVLMDHLAREIELKGLTTGINRMKKHFASYLRGRPRAAELRKRVFSTDSREEIEAAFEDYRNSHGRQAA